MEWCKVWKVSFTLRPYIGANIGADIGESLGIALSHHSNIINKFVTIWVRPFDISSHWNDYTNLSEMLNGDSLDFPTLLP